jgi:hypothetical protein
MEPFNMKEERQMGNIDENFNFTFARERGEVDAWLADLDEASMEKGIGEAATAMKVRMYANWFWILLISVLSFSRFDKTKRGRSAKRERKEPGEYH